jgi:hypothetical protein
MKLILSVFLCIVFLTNTLPEGLNEKFTENEKKLMKQYFTNEFMRLAPDNLKKYRSIWE